MANDLVLHSQTAAWLARFKAAPTHAVLLLGPEGIGKGSIARQATAELLDIPLQALGEHQACVILEPDDKQTISIEAIRTLQRFLRLKTTGTAAIRRVIIVEHAQCLTTEAQNAFLKILEEPPADTALLLTASSLHDVLPTIRSRTQHVTVLPPTKAQLLEHFSDHAEQARMQAFFLSGGLPGLMTALLSNSQEHPLVGSVTQAKAALQQDPFERLTAIEAVSKQKSDAVRFCQALERIAQSGLAHAATKADDKALRQWTRILRAAHQSKELLSSNVNTKLTLTHLMLQL